MRANPVSISTPIGEIVVREHASNSGKYSANIQSCPATPKLPPGMSVEGCHAAIIHLKSKEPLQDFVIECEVPVSGSNGNPESGECLDAFSWESDGFLVMVGTEDQDCLERRVRDKIRFQPDAYPIQCSDNKILISIPYIGGDQTVSFHWVVAWNKIPESVECSCWYAVDIPHRNVETLF